MRETAILLVPHTHIPDDPTICTTPPGGIAFTATQSKIAQSGNLRIHKTQKRLSWVLRVFWTVPQFPQLVAREILRGWFGTKTLSEKTHLLLVVAGIASLAGLLGAAVALERLVTALPLAALLVALAFQMVGLLVVVAAAVSLATLHRGVPSAPAVVSVLAAAAAFPGGAAVLALTTVLVARDGVEVSRVGVARFVRREVIDVSGKLVAACYFGRG